MERKQYIHYGSAQLHKIDPIRNHQLSVKPKGGLWASPVDSEFGWADFCRSEDICTESLAESFSFWLTENAKILHIYSGEQLDKLPKAKLTPDLEETLGKVSWITLDFEALEKQYDGIELHLSDEESDDGLFFELYGWDCDCILIFHDDVIEVIGNAN